MTREAEGRDAHRRNLKPRKEGAILASALEVGVAELFRRNAGWYWTCDSCGQHIRGVENGWVEWLRQADVSFGIRLVHHNHSCTYDVDKLPEAAANTSARLDGRPRVLDHSLDHFIADSARLITLALWNWDAPEELAILHRRLFLPGFEQVRAFIEDEALPFATHDEVREAFALLLGEMETETAAEKERLANQVAIAEFIMGIDDDDKDDDQ